MSKDKANKTQGATYCRPEKKGKGPAQRTSGRYCPDCKLRVRGENHAEGKHHKERA
jgi:hypothetical protein